MSEPAYDPSATADDDLLAALADDFAARLRRGERATVEEYVAKHPGLEERIRRSFPAIALIEQTHSAGSTSAGEGTGATIDRYKLLERIGEGGFGVVYMAEQHHPVRRRVALKVVKPGMDSRQVLARFEAERQALAIMDHPNIAKVFDGGMTDSGRPYFVMELVRGEPITEYCDRNHLPPRQRLELFAQVCHAVQHAHQKGVIHRDIKPSNVLVALHDTTPVVKVIDFGIAKALGQELTDKTLFTGFAQLVGTPLYMSPEQAGQSAIDVDTRSDIYSLGVLLYELLTGTTPFDKERFHRAAHEEIRRIIREEEPPRPSTRLSESKDRLPSISAQRHTEPAKLAKLVRGELDWIVMKALEKDRARRYETANGFAADVHRYLASEAVLACPPSATYRLKKFARRNKAALTTASVICLALLFAVGSFGWTVRDRTARHARVAGQVELILTEVDQLEREQKWPEALVAARRAGAVLAGGEADAATTRHVRDRIKDHEFVDRLERARMLQAAWVGQTFDYAAADRAYAEAFRGYGVDVDQLAVEAAVQRLKTRRQFAIPFAAALDNWVAARRVTNPDLEHWTRLVAVARGIDPEPVRDRLRATLGRPTAEVAAELLRLAGSIDVRAQHPATIQRLAQSLQRANQPDAALGVLRDAQRAYPADFWLSFELAHALDGKKDDEGAIRYYTAAVAIRPQSVAALQNLGNRLKNQKKLSEAIGCYRKAIEIDPEFAYGYQGLGSALGEQGKLDEAVGILRRAAELDPSLAASVYSNLGWAFLTHKKPDAAVAAFRKNLEYDPSAPTYANLGKALSASGKLDAAVVAYRKAVELAPKAADGWNTLGVAQYRAGELKQAIASLQKHRELRAGDAESTSPFFLAMAHRQLGNNDEALEWFVLAVDWMERTRAKGDEMLRARAEAEGLLGVMPPEHLAAARQRTRGYELAELTQGVQRHPGSPNALAARAHWLLAHGRFEEAERDYARLVQLHPTDHWHWVYRAGLLAYLGREQDYRGHCAAMLDEFADGHDALALHLTTRAALLLPPPGGAGRDVQKGVLELARRAERAHQLEPGTTWAVLVMGIAEHRAGRHQEAAGWLEKFHQIDPGGGWAAGAVTTDSFLALARDRLGQQEQARAALARAASRAAADLARADCGNYRAAGNDILDWPMARVALWEAEAAVLDRPRPAPPQASGPPVPTPPPAPSDPSPFGGKPAAVPGVVQAEAFDDGGQGVAYYDLTWPSFGNRSASPGDRVESVDLDDCADEGGGRNVGHVLAGEWLAYTVEVKDAGTYDLSLRLCSPAGGKLHVEFAGTDLTGPVDVPASGWGNWVTVTAKGVRLDAGRQVMRVVFDAATPPEQFVCNLNWVEVRRAP